MTDSRIVTRDLPYGSTLQFTENGVKRKIVVLDGMWRPQYNMIVDPGVKVCTNIERYGYIDSDVKNCTFDNASSITDAQLDNLPLVYDENTGLTNTNNIASLPDNPIRQQLTNIEQTLNVKNVELPNIQTLMRIFCEGSKIDALDPGVKDYPLSSLRSKFEQGVWSSTCFRNTIFWVMYSDGFVFCADGGNYLYHIVPIIDITEM